jgi:hypothetical protein
MKRWTACGVLPLVVGCAGRDGTGSLSDEPYGPRSSVHVDADAGNADPPAPTATPDATPSAPRTAPVQASP